MTIDYEPMWAVVDAHRHAADELEKSLRSTVGERPAPKIEGDKIFLFADITRALSEAQLALDEMADRVGHSVTRQHANKCRAVAGRCARAAVELEKTGEL